MKTTKRKIPLIHAGASADIAFLLLAFFLITSSFDPRTGIYRKMNAPTNVQAHKERMDIRQQNLLTLSIDESNQLWNGDEKIALKDVRDLSKAFIFDSEIPQHVISLEVSPEATYQTYLSVLSELTAAYNELRAEVAYERYNTSFLRLTLEQKDSIRTEFPVHIAEKESTAEKGGQP